MNYIKRLEIELAQANEDKKAIAEMCNDLSRYLNSSKFHNDTTVQVSDIHARTTEIRMMACTYAR